MITAITTPKTLAKKKEEPKKSGIYKLLAMIPWKIVTHLQTQKPRNKVIPDSKSV
jgi:hypothetical protein